MTDEPELKTFLGLPTIVASRSMEALYRFVKKVARTSVAVLITGETGCGKEHIARAIHHFSARGHKPWVDFNCAALPESLLESELFGYDKGAFSGAETAKPGMFELAHTGTILLDEVGELGARLQVKLLRVLDGIPFYRVGGTRKVSVDVRVIAATNGDLEQAMREGAFRPDLYHRLAQVRIAVPPLRERREEILPLADFLLKQLDPTARLSAEAVKFLECFEWPGNIRELRNAVIEAYMNAEGCLIGAEHLPAPLLMANLADGERGSNRLEDLERKAIMDVLAMVGDRRKEAAGILGISTRTLARRLRSYAIEGEEVAC